MLSFGFVVVFLISKDNFASFFFYFLQNPKPLFCGLMLYWKSSALFSEISGIRKVVYLRSYVTVTCSSLVLAFGKVCLPGKGTLCRKGCLVAHASERSVVASLSLLVVSQSKVRRVRLLCSVTLVRCYFGPLFQASQQQDPREAALTQGCRRSRGALGWSLYCIYTVFICHLAGPGSVLREQATFSHSGLSHGPLIFHPLSSSRVWLSAIPHICSIFVALREAGNKHKSVYAIGII